MIKWLGFILALGLILRVVFLTSVPPELFGDEIDVGYQAYSLLKTGRDIYKQALPLYVHSLSEWRAPLLVYQTVPTIAVFGLSEYGVRLPEVLMGILSPLILFILVYQHSRSKKLAFWSATALMLMPWHIIYSRMAGFGAITLVNLLMLAVILLKSGRHYLGILLAVLCFYTYNTSFIFIPLLLIGLRYVPKLKPALVGILLLLPLGYYLFLGPVGNRFGQLSIVGSKEFVESINLGRIAHPGLLGRIVYNRYTEFAKVFSIHYLQSFSTEFLFVRGDPVYRHSVQIVGGMLPVSIVFFVLGLVYLFKEKERFWLWWLAIAPISSALTIDGGYHATRTFLMVPILAIILARGFLALKNMKLVWLAVSAIFAIQLINFAFFYTQDFPKKSWRWWGVGYKNTLQALSKMDNQYSRVLINNTYEPTLMRFLFWTKFDPAKFQKDFVLDQPQKDILPNYDGFSLGSKYIFGRFNKSNYALLPGAVYLISQREEVAGDWDFEKSPPEGVKVIHTNRDPYGNPLFYLVTKK